MTSVFSMFPKRRSMVLGNMTSDKDVCNYRNRGMHERREGMRDMVLWVG